MGYRFKFLSAKILPLLLLSCVGCSGCLKKKDNKSKKNKNQGLIQRSDVSIDRTFTRKAAIIRFKTTAPALCSLKIWAQDDTEEPKKDSPLSKPCENKSELTEFNELITGLAPDILYEIEITAWEPSKGENRAEKLIVQEKQADEQSPGGKTSGLFVVRFDLPLLTAEVHRFAKTDSIDTNEIRSGLERKLGCVSGFKKAGSYEEAASGLSLEKLSTAQYALSQGTKHAHHDNRMRLNFQSVQSGDSWQWNYRLSKGTTDAFISKQAAEFVKVTMGVDPLKELGTPQLKNAEAPVDIDGTSDLKLTWATENLAEGSLVTVLVGFADDPKSIHCTFRASKEGGGIESSLLANLAGGRHEVLVSLETSQIVTPTGDSKPTWLIQTYDWRSSRVNKL